MTPDVLVVCEVNWDDSVPLWLSQNALVVDTRPPSAERELIHVIRAGIERVERPKEAHIAPGAARVVALSLLMSGQSERLPEALSAIERLARDATRCLGHAEAFRAFSDYNRGDDEALV